VLGLFGNLDVRNGKLTEHFLTFSIFHDDTWCGLSRYHDFDYLEHGPSAMAHFLKLDIDEVFPIYFDIRRFSLGNEEVLSGQIMKNPVNKLSRGEIVALAVP
jgi:hypothetical protein